MMRVHRQRCDVRHDVDQILVAADRALLHERPHCRVVTPTAADIEQLLHQYIGVLTGELRVITLVIAPGLRKVATRTNLEQITTVGRVRFEFQHHLDRFRGERGTARNSQQQTTQDLKYRGIILISCSGASPGDRIRIRPSKTSPTMLCINSSNKDTGKCARRKPLDQTAP